MHLPAALVCACQLNILFNPPPKYPLPNSLNVPFSAISRAARMKPPHAVRASEPPTLMRRTPRSAASATERPDAPIRRFTGLGCTAVTAADFLSPGFLPRASRPTPPPLPQ